MRAGLALNVLAYTARSHMLRAATLPYARRTLAFGFNPNQLRWPKNSPNGWGGRWMKAPWKIGSELLGWADRWSGSNPPGWKDVVANVAAMNDAGIDTDGETLWRRILNVQNGIREAQSWAGTDPEAAAHLTEADEALGQWADQGAEALDMVLENARWLRDTGAIDAPPEGGLPATPPPPARLDVSDLDFGWLNENIDPYDLNWLKESYEGPRGTFPGSAVDGLDGRRFTAARQQEYRSIAEEIVGKTYDARKAGGDEAPVLQRKATVLGGGAGSGKSSLLKLPEMADSRDGAALIGGDEVRVNLSSYSRIHKVAPTEAAGVVHAESMVVTDRLHEMAQKAGIKFVADQTSSGDVRLLQHQIDELHAAGYEVEGAFAFADPHEAWVRSLIRGVKKGRFMPYQALLRSHRGAARNFRELVNSYDTASVRDTSGAAPKLIAQKLKGGQLEVLDPDGWDRFTSGGDNAHERDMTYNDFLRIAQAAVAGGHRIPPAIYAMAIDAGVDLSAIVDEVKKEHDG